MFEVATARLMGSPIPHNSAAHRCVWSPDGSTFATVNWGGEVIRVWRPPVEPDRNNANLAAADGPFVRFNADGDRWIPCGFDGHRDRRTVQAIDASSGQAVGAVLSGAGLISDADFVPRSNNIVLVGSQSADSLQSRFLEQNPDSNGVVRFVDAQNGRPAFADVATPTQPVAVRVSPNGTTAVVLCHRGQVLLVNTADGQVRFQADAFGGQPATHGYVIRDRIRFSPKGDLFAIWGCREFIEVRETTTGTLRHVLRHERDFVHDVQFSPDAALLASCSSDQSVRLWNVAKGSLERTLPHPGWIFNAQFSNDGSRLFTACDDRHARIWDVETGKSLLATFEQPDQVFGVCLLPDEEFFLTSDRTGRITAWDSRLGKMIAPAREMGRMVYQLSLSGSGRDVVASGRIHPSQAIHLDGWILSPESEWSREEMLRLGEILSSQTIRQGGAVTSLTTNEWMLRWKQFQAQPNRTIESVY
jgi:WD40 repeat protein